LLGKTIISITTDVEQGKQNLPLQNIIHIVPSCRRSGNSTQDFESHSLYMLHWWAFA